MLGSKKGMRDINRGMEDISRGVSDIKAAFAKNPEDKIAILEKQRERHLDEARKNRQKAKGILAGPARLRMAEASEASADEALAKIQKLKAAHGIEDAPAEATGVEVADRLREVRALLDQGLITDEEYARKRDEVLGDL